MRFVDLDDGKVFTVPDLHRDWQVFKAEDPINHAETFKRELFEIIDATLRGRNDLEIICLTPAEVFNVYTKLMKEV